MAVELPDIDFCLQYQAPRDQRADVKPRGAPRTRKCKGCKKTQRIGSFVSSRGSLMDRCQNCRKKKP
jgi:hypothetical protein